jgi:hypothetical protein
MEYETLSGAEITDLLAGKALVKRVGQAKAGVLDRAAAARSVRA